MEALMWWELFSMSHPKLFVNKDKSVFTQGL